MVWVCFVVLGGFVGFNFKQNILSLVLLNMYNEKLTTFRTQYDNKCMISCKTQMYIDGRELKFAYIPTTRPTTKRYIDQLK